MPDRIVRQDILTSDAVNALSCGAEVFYRRLMSVADDFGRYDARPDILRGSLYSLKLDSVSKSDVVKWLSECSKAGLLGLYSTDGRNYLEILKFGQRLRAMKSKYPVPAANDSTRGHPPSNDSTMRTSDNIRGHMPPEEKRNESESETESKKPNGFVEPAGSPPDPKEVFKGVEKKKRPLYDFIAAYKPDFVEPYVELWNLFAAERSKPRISKVSDARAKKFRTRIKEPAFDFLKILTKAGAAGDFLSTSKWFTWDWIMESEANYLKVIEGNYDKDSSLPPKEKPKGAPALTREETELNYLYERFLEDQITVISVHAAQYNFLKTVGMISFSEEESARIKRLAIEYLAEKGIESTPEKEMQFMKCFGVLEFFKQLRAKGQGAIFTS